MNGVRTMPKRLDHGIIPCNSSLLKKGQFFAKWPGVCNQCGFSYEKGDVLHYVGDKVAHVTCRGFAQTVRCSDGSGTEFDSHEEREPRPTVKGARQPKLCTDCWQEHNGECP